MKVWRDLEEGEVIKIGDRCCGVGNKWFEMDRRVLEMHSDAEGSFVKWDSFPFQREVILNEIEG